MSVKLYIILCGNCNYKKLTDGSDLAFLNEVKTCKDCGGSRQFKCPKCGYLMRARKAPVETTDAAMKQLQILRDQEQERINLVQKDRAARLREKRLQDKDGPDQDTTK